MSAIGAMTRWMQPWPIGRKVVRGAYTHEHVAWCGVTCTSHFVTSLTLRGRLWDLRPLVVVVAALALACGAPASDDARPDRDSDAACPDSDDRPEADSADAHPDRDSEPDGAHDGASPACREAHAHMAAGGAWCATSLESGIVPVFSVDACAWCYLAVCHADSAPTFVRVECASLVHD